MPKEIVVPDIGDFDSVEVIEVLVAPGDSIQAEDSLISVESDKATMEIPAPEAGLVKEVKVAVGDKVSEGSLILMLEPAEASVETAPVEEAPASAEEASATAEPAPASTPASAPAPVSASKASPTAKIDEVSFSKAHASPAVRKFARELGVDLGLVDGSGPKGRIVKGDVKSFVKRALSQPAAAGGLGVAPMPDIDFSQWGEVESKPLTKINKLTGQFLHRNWVTVPHVTQFDEADITDLEVFRKSMAAEYKEKGIRITPLVFLMKALVSAMKELPRFNASLDASGENLIFKQYYNIGIAVDTPDGLVVPVVQDVDRKSLVDLAVELGEISVKAREKKLKPSDMQGGCMTISSLGGIGGTAFTPIVNAPEVAILGVSRSKMQPVWNGEEFKPRLVLPLALSYDHRVIDGADGARFTSFLSRVLSDTRRLLL
ncbi:MAG TPA: dihydrolipoyllysine-residue acetyltransferase [Chromatiales bacterium]|nr:dihydrolipoyllysine-residue acetyltransferase [Chromatiales bacterium]HEX23260.1 dihydrolipoyllysine-residue acetyltransferase [Chromatiales bacterium]